MTRVLIAHDAGAEIYDYSRYGKQLQHRSSIPFEEGRKRRAELETDRSGAAVDPNTGRSHSVARHVTPREKNRERFAKQLCAELQRAYAAEEFAGLVLIAPDRMLAQLRKHLDKRLQRTLRGSIAKDLAMLDSHPREARLRELLEETLLDDHPGVR